jgi:hypothetical protein
LLHQTTKSVSIESLITTYGKSILSQRTKENIINRSCNLIDTAKLIVDSGVADNVLTKRFIYDLCDLVEPYSCTEAIEFGIFPKYQIQVENSQSEEIEQVA